MILDGSRSGRRLPDVSSIAVQYSIKKIQRLRTTKGSFQNSHRKPYIEPGPPPSSSTSRVFFERSKLSRRTKQSISFFLLLFGISYILGGNGWWQGWGSSDRDRSGNHLLVRRSVAARPGGDHRQWPGQSHNPFLRRVHRHRAAHRRRCQESGRHEPYQHRVR